MTSTDSDSGQQKESSVERGGDEYTQKMKEFEERLKKNPNDFEVYFYRGNYLNDLGLYNRSIKDYSRFLNAQKHPQCLFTRALSYSALGEYHKAIGDCTEAIKMDPNYCDAFLTRGNSFKKLGERTKSMKDYSEAIRINPKNSMAYYNRGTLYYALGEYEKAVQDYDRAISIQPDFAKALYNRGTAYHKLGEDTKAIQDYNEAILLDPKYSEAYSNRGLSYQELREYKQAIQDYNETIRLDPTYYFAYNNRGNVYNDLGEYEKAIADFTEAIRLDPNLSDFYNNRGLSYFKQQKYDLAKKDLLTSISLNPSNELPLCNLGKLFLELGDIQKGNEYYKKAMEENPNSAQVYLKRFKETSSLDEERALEDYFRCVELFKSKKQKVGREEEVKKIFDRLSSKIEETNHWLPFTEDKHRDEQLEKIEIEEMKKKIQGQDFGRKGTNLRLFRFLGRGVFCSTYLCQIFGIPNIFVIKVVHKRLMGTAKLKIMKDRDCVDLPYHRNICMILSNFDQQIELDLHKLPDFKTEFWRKWTSVFGRKTTLSTPLILMKYYRKSLGKYVSQRKTDNHCNAPFDPLELIYMLKGLLKGVYHLYKNMIVHRDLHSENVFVDTAYGRIILGDFGCCLDLRNNKTGFKVKVDQDFEPSLYHKISKSGALTAYKGGCEDYLAPEIADCGKVDVVDYSKNDLFSVGMLGYFLVDSFKNGKLAPFGVNRDGDSISRNRKQEEYVDLKIKEKRISNLIKNLLLVDPTKRIGHLESIYEIEEIQKFHVRKIKVLGLDQNVMKEEELLGVAENVSLMMKNLFVQKEGKK